MTEIIEKTEQRTVSLEKISATEVELRQLAADYHNYLVTEENLKEADEVRLKLYRPRIEIQRAEKANKVIIDKLYDENKNRAASLINLIQPTEKAIEQKILVVKNAIAEKARIAAANELKRVTDHQNRIKAANDVIRIGAVAGTEEELVRLKKQLENNFVDHDFEEFKTDAQQILINANTVLAQRSEFLDMKAKREKAEKEAAEIKKQPELNLVPSENHSHENVLSPDTPGVIKENFPNTVKEYPLTQIGNGVSGSKPQQPFNFKSDLEPWSYSGYNFGIDSTLSEDARNNIKHCLTEILDNLPM